MPMAVAGSRVRECGSIRLVDDPFHPHSGKEEPVSTSAAMDKHGISLRSLRFAVFGSIGALYLASLFVPSLRQALATVFSFFPR